MNKNYTILLAEDELSLALIVKESLETRDFTVLHCADGETALQVYEKSKPDILVLDVMMPKMDGFTLAKIIRISDKKTPILFLTSKSQSKDVVEGFTIGGNDYLKKPFSMEELIVRINSLLNKTQSVASQYTIGKYYFDTIKQTLYFAETTQALTHRESQLLEMLFINKNEVLLRKNILENIWGNDDFFSGRSMDVFITKLRKKISLDSTVQILNIRGQGYKLIC